MLFMKDNKTNNDTASSEKHDKTKTKDKKMNKTPTE